MKARRFLDKGCQGFLAYIINSEVEQVDVQSIPIARKYSDVFLRKLLGLPLERKVEFTIELTLGTRLVLITPYRMAPLELKELKVQLQDLLDKGFIRSSTSP